MSDNTLIAEPEYGIEEYFKNKYVALSNAMIQARKKTSLLESKIELLAAYKLINESVEQKKTDVKGKPYTVNCVTIRPAEIGRLMKKRVSGSFYPRIIEASAEMKQKMYIYRDDETEQFTMKSLYGDVKYDRGTLTIEFNPETEFFFRDLKNGYTKIKLDVAFSFDTNGGFQMYKLLERWAYELPPIDFSLSQKDQAAIVKEYDITEFRMELGFIDLQQAEIRMEALKKKPDADKLSRIEKNPKYRRWGDFYSRVVETGINEINEKSDIYIDYVSKKCGEHGKVEGVEIRIQRNKAFCEKDAVKSDTTTKAITSKALTEDEIDEFIDQIREFIKETLKTKDLKAIAQTANYDFDKVEQAYKVASQKDVNNLTGFMIKAIEDGYETSTEKKRKTAFHNFNEREYNMDEVERQLLKAN